MLKQMFLLIFLLISLGACAVIVQNNDSSDTNEGDLFLEENIEGFRIFEVSTYSGQIENELFNESNNFRAFFTCDFHCNIFVEDIKNEILYQLDAPSFIPGRPFSNLEWTSATILEFRQATQPHHAVYYIIDVKKQELINAIPEYLP
ncbi:hypothetical protein [Candidatus Leptofilum sp.]|uniref:hypothetical protein n=1 Tax=Candidatus Leptofilum sp. TaxID=3241576 RepID=UPI003B5A82C4